jgi:hypothetical protein
MKRIRREVGGMRICKARQFSELRKPPRPPNEFEILTQRTCLPYLSSCHRGPHLEQEHRLKTVGLLDCGTVGLTARTAVCSCRHWNTFCSVGYNACHARKRTYGFELPPPPQTSPTLKYLDLTSAAAALQTCIRKVPGSNPNRITDSPISPLY